MSSKQKTTLTDIQKHEFCIYAQSNNMTHAKYVDWIEEKWGVRVHESTITRILQTKDKWLTTEIVNPEKKRNRAITIPALELALHEFVLTYQHRTILSDAILTEKARLLADGLGVSEGTLQFSSGWLHKFKERNGIRKEKLHGEAESANNIAIMQSHPLLKNKCANYSLELIYNMDETALFYRLEPDYSLATQRLSGKSVLLLLDNCSSHKTDGLVLQNVKICFLPKNTTSKIQPMDAGIIISFKKNYHHHHIRWMLDQIESGENAQDLKIDILQERTIQNCWRHTNILSIWDNIGEDEILHDEPSLDELLLEELSKNIEDLNFSDPMRVEEYLNIPDKDIVYKVPDEDQIILDLVETFRERPDEMKHEDSEEADDSIENKIINPNKALKSLENVCTFLLQQEDASECIKLVSMIEKFIIAKKKDLMKQSTIDQYFNINVDKTEVTEISTDNLIILD
ncbi:24008_t:CDS:2 [Racocetra persica]|uniref:24008_t:CDS:1 n=1 Tax=Racocetra persica TaxID=160502 RepID=A0ACA9MTY8_9GLOM|nr:24008_t:CDS:2 [Racocetra persica]